MGMFDSIAVPCPKCGKEIEFQTKVFGGSLEWWSIKDAPAAALADMNGEWFRCECGYCFEARVKVCRPTFARVSRKKIEKAEKNFDMVWGDSAPDDDKEE